MIVAVLDREIGTIAGGQGPDLAITKGRDHVIETTTDDDHILGHVIVTMTGGDHGQDRDVMQCRVRCSYEVYTGIFRLERALILA